MCESLFELRPTLWISPLALWAAAYLVDQSPCTLSLRPLCDLLLESSVPFCMLGVVSPFCCSSLHCRITAALSWCAIFLTVRAVALLLDSPSSEDCRDLSVRYWTPVAGCRDPPLRAASSLSASCRCCVWDLKSSLLWLGFTLSLAIPDLKACLRKVLFLRIWNCDVCPYNLLTWWHEIFLQPLA